MVRKLLLLGVLALGTAYPVRAADTVDPNAEFKAFRDYFTGRFPKVPLDDFVNGPYSMDEGLRKQWKEIEEFPPYEFAVDKGKELFAKPFANGKTYGDCFPDQGVGIRQNYPYFDTKSGQVITLELALNRCREGNGEKPLDYVKDDMAALTAYMAFTVARQAASTSRSRMIRARSRPTARARNISTPGAASSTSRAPVATCSRPATTSAPRCLRPRSELWRQCRSTAPSGARWAPPAGGSRPATVRVRVRCRCRRRTNSIATSSTS